jgi:hypothetical protein
MHEGLMKRSAASIGVSPLRLCLLCALMLTINLSHTQAQQISAFLNVGQAIPLGKYRSNSSTHNPVETGKAKRFGQSINMGVNLFGQKSIGFCGGISVFDFKTDASAFEKMHLNNPDDNTESYVSNPVNGKIYAGISAQLKFQKLFIEPRLLLGYTGFVIDYSDYYQKSDNNTIYRTITYQFETSPFISYTGALNIHYDCLTLPDFAIGLQLYIDYSFQQPEIKYEKIESNSLTKTINISNVSGKQNISSLYYGLGIIFTL